MSIPTADIQVREMAELPFRTHWVYNHDAHASNDPLPPPMYTAEQDLGYFGARSLFSKLSVEVIINIQGVISVITDFIGAAFPILLLLNAKLHLRTKIALDLLMGLGVVTGTVWIVRTSYN